MIKVLELFGGIGAFSKALERCGIDYEIADYVEIDKYAVKSFNAMHNTNFEPQDIKEWNKDIKADIIMHGSPCQDFSIAGLQKGGDENSGTRSSLMYETLRIVEKIKPRIVIWENVKNLLSKAHKHNFEKYIERMEKLGYKNYYKVINAKSYVPQNRERLFVVSIKGEHNAFEFPVEQESDKCLKDILESEVDERYYIDDKYNEIEKKTSYSEIKGGMCEKWLQQNRRAYDKKSIAPTLTTCSGGNTQVKIIVHEVKKIVKKRKYEVDKENLSKLLKEQKQNLNLSNKDIADKLQCSITSVEHWFRSDDNFSIPSAEIWNDLKEILKINNDRFDKSITEFETIPGNYDKDNRLYNINELSPTATANSNNIKIIEEDTLRVRKLTSKEYWRLQGFDDSDYEKAAAVNSPAQLYKQAGNSIVVDVLCAIIESLKNAFDKNNMESIETIDDKEIGNEKVQESNTICEKTENQSEVTIELKDKRQLIYTVNEVDVENDFLKLKIKNGQKAEMINISLSIIAIWTLTDLKKERGKK